MIFSLTDDFEISNKAMGMKILKHILANIDATEFSWYRNIIVHVH